jgi:hypothetical protein
MSLRLAASRSGCRPVWHTPMMPMRAASTLGERLRYSTAPFKSSRAPSVREIDSLLAAKNSLSVAVKAMEQIGGQADETGLSKLHG